VWAWCPNLLLDKVSYDYDAGASDILLPMVEALPSDERLLAHGLLEMELELPHPLVISCDSCGRLDIDACDAEHEVADKKLSKLEEPNSSSSSTGAHSMEICPNW